MISFERQKSHSCIPMMAMFVDNLHVGSFMGHTVRVWRVFYGPPCTCMYGHSCEQNRYVIDKSGDKLPLTGGNCPGGGLSGGKCPTLDKLPPPYFAQVHQGIS